MGHSLYPHADPPRDEVARRAAKNVLKCCGRIDNRSTYYMACFQVNPSRLLTAAAEECDKWGLFRRERYKLTDTEHQRREPERVHRIGSGASGDTERELQTSGSDRREEGCDG